MLDAGHPLGAIEDESQRDRMRAHTRAALPIERHEGAATTGTDRPPLRLHDQTKLVRDTAIGRVERSLADVEKALGAPEVRLEVLGRKRPAAAKRLGVAEALWVRAQSPAAPDQRAPPSRTDPHPVVAHPSGPVGPDAFVDLEQGLDVGPEPAKRAGVEVAGDQRTRLENQRAMAAGGELLGHDQTGQPTAHDEDVDRVADAMRVRRHVDAWPRLLAVQELQATGARERSGGHDLDPGCLEQLLFHVTASAWG